MSSQANMVYTELWVKSFVGVLNPALRKTMGHLASRVIVPPGKMWLPPTSGKPSIHNFA